MTRSLSFATAAALLGVSAQPCLAAEDIRPLSNPQHRTAAFAGATLRFGLDRTPRPTKPQARLQAGFTHDYSDMRSAAPSRAVRVTSFEFGASAKGKPTLFMGGRDVRGFDRKLGVSTGGAIAIGAVVLVGALALLLATTPVVDEDTLCFDPECD